MKKYIVKRNEVQIGTLEMPLDSQVILKDKNGKMFKGNKLDISNIKSQYQTAITCRGMLFREDENGRAEDLIYTTPYRYYIDKTGKRIYDSAFDFVITNPYKINKLLEYLKYGEYLTQNDLNSIYRLLIAHRDWLSKNLELFGFKKTEEKTRKVVFPIETEVTLYDASISSVPFIEEPGYSLIKRKK